MSPRPGEAKAPRRAVDGEQGLCKHARASIVASPPIIGCNLCLVSVVRLLCAVWPQQHTFILYLRDCAEGGGTVLLRPPTNAAADSNSKQSEGIPVATVAPVRGRLLVFPHGCLHSGAATESVPKILLRGELF